MNTDMKERIVSLLEGYSKRERQIALLHYEMQHTARILPEEMIDTMSLGHSDGMGGSSKGHISNKTMYRICSVRSKKAAAYGGTGAANMRQPRGIASARAVLLKSWFRASTAASPTGSELTWGTTAGIITPQGIRNFNSKDFPSGCVKETNPSYNIK